MEKFCKKILRQKKSNLELRRASPAGDGPAGAALPCRRPITNEQASTIASAPAARNRAGEAATHGSDRARLGRLSCDPMSASSLAPRFMPPCTGPAAPPPHPRARADSSPEHPHTLPPSSPPPPRRICRPRAPSGPRGARRMLSRDSTRRRRARAAGAEARAPAVTSSWFTGTLA